MPAVSAPAKVLVTGASGFLAIHVVKVLIEKGFFVRGTVRSPAKGEYLKKLFGDKLELVVIEDMQAPGAYNKAVVGVDAVEHVASPFTFSERDPNSLIKPAVAGTLGILESVKKFGPTVKRVVITSSTVAVTTNFVDKSYIYTEADWNQPAVDVVTEQGANAPNNLKYPASKVLAERAAWDFVEKNKGEIGFDVTTVCPPWVFGPILHEVRDKASLNESTQYLIGLLDPKYESKGDDALLKSLGAYTDVRDVANIHVEVLFKEAAGNERYLSVAGGFTVQSIYNSLNEEPKFNDIPVGIPGGIDSEELKANCSSDKLLSLLGRPANEVFRPLRETMRDTVESIRAKGW